MSYLYDTAPLREDKEVWYTTEEIALPFSFSRDSLDKPTTRDGHPTAVDVVYLRDADYDPYDVYCFLSKLNEKLRDINDSWSATVVPKRHDGRSRMFLEVYQAGEFVPLDKELKSRIEPMIEECYTSLPEYCIIFSSKRVSISDGKYYPKEWIESMLPFLIIPSEIERMARPSYDIDPIHQNGCIYARLKRYSPYSLIAADISDWILEQLGIYYEAGAIILSPELDQEFIRNWMLGQGRSVGDLAMFIPMWTNTRLAPDRVRFLYERMVCNTIRYKPFRRSGTHSDRLSSKKLEYTIRDDYFTVKIDNYAQAQTMAWILCT